jgi:hypothetical protein
VFSAGSDERSAPLYQSTPWKRAEHSNIPSLWELLTAAISSLVINISSQDSRWLAIYLKVD